MGMPAAPRRRSPSQRLIRSVTDPRTPDSSPAGNDPGDHSPDRGRPSPRLRAATPADTEFLAWGIDEAAGGLFTTMLGPRAHAILAPVVAQPVHAYSFEHAVIAEVDGTPCGFCQGFPYGTPSGTQQLLRAAGIRALRAGAVALLGWPVFAALDAHSPGEWYLQAIAVAPQARGAGVGAALFADAFQRAADSRCDTLSLDVDVANVRARALYERLGLQVESTSGKAVLLDNAQINRMTAVVPPHDDTTPIA